MENFKKLFNATYDIKDIKKITVNTANNTFDTTDKNISFKMLKWFNWLDNYYWIHFKNWDIIYIWDFQELELINTTAQKETLKDYLDNLLERYSIQELNSFILPLIKSQTKNIY